MANVRPQVLVACDKRVREGYLPPQHVERLEALAEWDWFECEGGGIYSASEDTAAASALAERLHDIEALIVCHGAPKIDAAILDKAPKLKFIGELEGDRFANRLDLEAVWKQNIRTVDTTNASSYPVAEWALGLILVSLRNAGAHFRRMINGQTRADGEIVKNTQGLLKGKRVGLLGGGHMGRHLMGLLKPFEVDIWVYDPYLPRELAEAVGFVQTALENVMSQCDVIVSLVPLTSGTQGMIGQQELDMIRPGTVLVNVSRGPVIEGKALVERLKRGDIVAGLDVFDPEPVPADSEILQLPNVFLTPHVGYINGDIYPHFFALMVDELERFFGGHDTWFDLTDRSLANRQGDTQG